MWIVFLAVVVVPLAYALGVAVHYYRKFRRTEAYRWRNDVLGREAALRRAYRAAKDGGRRTDLDALREKYFAEHLRTVGVDAVAQFTGIGPGTVDRLRQAGLRTLADLIDYPFHRLPGIGPSKSADLRAAVRELVADARRRFEGGDCAKGLEFRDHRDRVRRREREEDEDRERRLKELTADLRELGPQVAVAKRITLWNFFWHDGRYPGYADVAPPVARRDPEERAGPAATDVDNDVRVVLLPPHSNPAKMSPESPTALNVTVQCAACDARLQVTSSRPRPQYRVTCPRCGAVSTITPPAKPAPLPVVKPLPVATPVPPPVPVPANAPVAVRPSTAAPVPPPRMSAKPPGRALPSSGQPTDLFADALKSSAPAPAPAAEHPELPKLRALAGFGLMVAKADGRIAKAERAAVREFLATLFGHDPVLARHLDPVIETVEKAIPAEPVAVAEVVRRTSPNERRRIYLAAERIADACGKRNRQEEDLLERVAVALDVQPSPKIVSAAAPPPRVQSSAAYTPAAASAPAAPKPPVEPPQLRPPDPRKLLEIEPGVELSVELIRRRFTLLFEKVDPAKARDFGPEFVAMVEKKRADLRAAAESLIAPFGVPLDPPAAPPPSADIRPNELLDDIFG